MKKKIIPNILGVIVTFILVAAPAPAQANPIADFFRDTNRELQNAVKFYESLIDDLNSIGRDNDIVIQNAKGKLELPDLEKIEDSITNQLDNNGDLNKAGNIITAVKSSAINAHSNSILSTEGQETDAEALETVTDAVATIAAIEAQSQNRDVSQEVLKDLAEQQAHLAVINGSLNKSLVELKQTTAYNNIAVAKSIQQQQNAAQRLHQESQGTMITEIAITELLKANLYGSKRCQPGQQTVFITQEQGQSIPPRKECR